MSEITLDADMVCNALQLDPADLATMFRHEAARRLETLAASLREPHGIANENLVDEANRLLLAAVVFDEEWERRHPEREEGGGSSTRNGGDPFDIGEAAADRSEGSGRGRDW